jgi:drug/metabolite transporter (DMT)-like permease
MFPRFRSELWQQPAAAEAIFVGVVALWGLTFVLSKNALAAVGPFAYNSLRMGLGTLILALLAGRGWRAVGRSYAGPVLVTGLVLFSAYALQSYGQQFTTASKAGFLTGTSVAYVPLFSALLLRRRPGRAALLGVALALAGLYLLSGAVGLRLAPGDVWVALGGIGWALYIILLACYSPRVHLLAFSALHVALAGLLSAAVWVLAEPLVWPRAPAVWWAIGITGALIIGLGTSVQTWVTCVAAPTRVALIATLEPVFAAVAGLLVGELLMGRTWLGGGLIVTGMLVAELGSRLRLGPPFRAAARLLPWRRTGPKSPPYSGRVPETDFGSPPDRLAFPHPE